MMVLTPLSPRASSIMVASGGEDDSDDDDEEGSSVAKRSRQQCQTSSWRFPVAIGMSLVLALALSFAALSRQTVTDGSVQAGEVNESSSLRQRVVDAQQVELMGVDSQRPRKHLYCIMVMLPFGHELELVRHQYENGWGIFGCDGYDVLSNISVHLGSNYTSQSFGGSMVVKFNTWTWSGRAKLALNTPVFIRAWKLVFEMGKWQNYDWTVKLDPDTVFFPGRLSDLIRMRPLMPDGETLKRINPTDDSCVNCSQSWATDEPCAGHLSWLQSGDAKTCGEALTMLARDAPLDCGCRCGTEACRRPLSVYYRNCAFNRYGPWDQYRNHALHGPLEVLSRGAVEDFKNGLGSCVTKLNSSFDQWGEDWFLEHCLIHLGVNPLDSFASLLDGDCAAWPWPCDQAHAAFQPFKTLDGYKKCQENAEKNGHWPPNEPIWR